MYLRERLSVEKVAKSGKKKLKKFQKTLDKPQKVWYNIKVVKVRGAHLNRPTQKIILI